MHRALADAQSACFNCGRRNRVGRRNQRYCFAVVIGNCQKILILRNRVVRPRVHGGYAVVAELVKRHALVDSAAVEGDFHVKRLGAQVERVAVAVLTGFISRLRAAVARINGFRRFCRVGGNFYIGDTRLVNASALRSHDILKIIISRAAVGFYKLRAAYINVRLPRLGRVGVRHGIFYLHKVVPKRSVVVGKRQGIWIFICLYVVLLRQICFRIRVR